MSVRHSNASSHANMRPRFPTSLLYDKQSSVIWGSKRILPAQSLNDERNPCGTHPPPCDAGLLSGSYQIERHHGAKENTSGESSMRGMACSSRIAALLNGTRCTRLPSCGARAVSKPSPANRLHPISCREFRHFGLLSESKALRLLRPYLRTVSGAA